MDETATPDAERRVGKPSDPRGGSGRAEVRLHHVSVAWPSSDDPGATTVVLDELDLTVAAGSFTAIVGPSGCGKSTILRILAGLLEPDTGTATVAGTDVINRPGACAWLSQRDDLLPWRRVLGNATLGAELGGRARRDAEAAARPLLARFGLAGVERAWPSQLSGGMRQRLAVLRTFLVDAPVLLLDEPFGALDALTRRQMQAWLQQVWLEDFGSSAGPGVSGVSGDDQGVVTGDGADRGRHDEQAGAGRTVLLVTHDVEEALLLADRVVVLSLRPGRIVADLGVDFARPRPAELVSEPAFVARRAELLTALGA